MNDEKLAMATFLRREISSFEKTIKALSDPDYGFNELCQDYPEIARKSEEANIFKLFRESLVEDYSRRLELMKHDFESI